MQTTNTWDDKGEEYLAIGPDAIRDTIRDYIKQAFLLGGDEAFADEDSLIEGGIVDSVGVLELVSFLEQRFTVEVGDADLVPENLDSVAGMVRFVAARRGVVQ